VDGFDPDAAAASLTQALLPFGSAARAAQEKRYLKSDLEFIGVAVPDLRRTVKAAVRDHLVASGKRGVRLDRETALAWALALWREPVHERRAAAVEILQLAVTNLNATDLAAVEQLIRGARTWAYVDALAGNIAGAVALRDVSSWQRIDAWAGDDDFWVRRSALLSLLPGIRAGQPGLPRFVRYADPMLAEREFFIRKALGWVLREISRQDPAWVAAWTEDRVPEISGVTFREAVRHLPPAAKARLEMLYASRPRRRSTGKQVEVEADKEEGQRHPTQRPSFLVQRPAQESSRAKQDASHSEPDGEFDREEQDHG
jgi:3-methyladenine DNA glycosylase AlkD